MADLEEALRRVREIEIESELALFLSDDWPTYSALNQSGYLARQLQRERIGLPLEWPEWPRDYLPPIEPASMWEPK